jgi:glycosyltransferase involved in cell wall biosynthesis
VRIGIDASRTVVAQRTGTERYSLELIRALLALPTAHRYLLYFNQPPPAGLLPATGNWTERSLPLPRLWSHLSLSRAVAVDQPDLLFVPAHVLPLGAPARSVVTVHDLGFRFFPRAHPPLAWLYLELSTRWAARQATRIIAISESTRRDLVALYGVREERVRVVYEAADATFKPTHDPAVVQRHGLSPGQYLLAVGTLQPRKNLSGLLRGFRLYADGVDEPMPLALVGRPGWGVSALEREVRRLGLERLVRRLGYVSDDELPALYSGAFAYLQPSLYEGFGLTVLEAMACGTPVIVSSSSSLPEVVGGTGLQIDSRSPPAFAGAIRELIERPALRAELARTGRQRASSFSGERCARETLTVLEEAASAE